MSRARDTPRHRCDVDTYRCTRFTRTAHVPTVGKAKAHANKAEATALSMALAQRLTPPASEVAVRLIEGAVAWAFRTYLECVCVSCPKEKPIYDTLIDTLSSPKAA